ncbi:uncharacterized protein [Danio rerio]|uniref:Uncharacterized protein n=1 Tax=Danio rerio TaxID=7955 RepID=A0A8M3B297_DANRE|nr:uncharacterized protein LOC101884100 [Danio rerio]|eukprot:XP_009302539.1 uncharacterized protein LOC101884100 [Danio rerio]
MYSVSDGASCSEYARRDTRPSDAIALRCCDAAAKHKCVQWKTPKRDFTKDSSLSAISKTASQQTGFNSADIAYKPHMEAFAFQRQDEKLSSCTFHELLQSSWMSANLHCSMLHFNTTEHAISFMERQAPNLSTSAVSALTIPAKSEKCSYIPGDITRQRKNELFLCCNTRFGCSQMQREPTPNKTGRSVDFVRDTRPDGNKCAFDKVTKIYTLEQKDRLSQILPLVIPEEDIKNRMQTKQKVSQRRARKHRQASDDGLGLTFWQQCSPGVKCKAVGATEAQKSAQLVVAPEAYDDLGEKKIEERCDDLCRLHLQLRCLRMWCKRLRLLSQACCHDRRRILNKALYVLRLSVKMRWAQTDAVDRRRSAFLLSQSFYQWKNHYDCRHFHSERKTDDLRKRLIQPSRPLLVMSTCSTWWSRHMLRTAMIHNHLSVLYKHWLLWRQRCLKRITMRQQEKWACLWWDRRLQSKALTLWITSWKRDELATHQYSTHLLALAWTKWKFRTSQKKLEKLMQSIQMSNLLYFFHHWQKRAESCKRERENQFVLTRRTLHSWHCYVHETKLTRLSLRASWELSRRMLAETFRKWRHVAVRMQDTRRFLEKVRHLQDKGRMQTAFTMWCQSTRKREELRKLQESLLRAQLSRCLSAWRAVVQRRASLQRYYHHRETQTLKTSFQQWRLSLQLHGLLKDFHIHRFHTRHTNTDKPLITGRMMDVFKRKAYTSAEDLSAMFLLHNTLHKWAEILQKQQLAKLAEERVIQKTVLLEWYRHTQADFSDKVLLFKAKLAPRPPSSTGLSCCDSQMSCIEPQALLLKALGRMMHPELCLAFSKWRSVVCANRDMRRQADLCLNSRRCEEMAGVFRAWRAHTLMNGRAFHHWERSVLFHFFILWKGMVQQRCRTHMLEQNAVFTHDINLLRRCFSTWTRLAVGSHCEQLKCVLQQMERRTDTHRLNLSFSTWVMRVNQQKTSRGFYIHTLQSRCFSQWLHEFRHRSELLCLSRELEEVGIQRLQWRTFCLWQLKLTRVQTHMQHISSLWKNTRHLRLHLRVWRQRVIQRKKARVAVHLWKQHISQARRQRDITREMKNLFLHWRAAFRQSVRSRDHYTQTQESRVLLAWHRHTVSAQRLRYREAWFQYSSEMRLQAAVFMQWRTALISSQQRKHSMESQLICESRIRESAFHRWKTAATERRAMKAFNNRFLHKWFNRWKHRKDLLNVADTLCLKTRRHEARLAFRTWSLWAKDCKAQRQMREAVSLWLDGRAVSRTFHHWLRVYQQYQKASRHRQMQLSHRALDKGVHGLIYLYWSSWKNQTEASLLYTQRFQHCVLQKSWLTWRKRHIRNRVSADYSDNFNSTLLAKVLHVWWLRAHGSDFEP